MRAPVSKEQVRNDVSLAVKAINRAALGGERHAQVGAQTELVQQSQVLLVAGGVLDQLVRDLRDQLSPPGPHPNSTTRSFG